MNRSKLLIKMSATSGRIWRLLDGLLEIITEDDLAPYGQSNALPGARLAAMAQALQLPATFGVCAQIEIALWLASDVLLAYGDCDIETWLDQPEVSDDQWARAIGCLSSWVYDIRVLDFEGLLAELTFADLQQADDLKLPATRLSALAEALDLRGECASDLTMSILSNMISYLHLVCKEDVAVWNDDAREEEALLLHTDDDAWLRITGLLSVGFNY